MSRKVVIILVLFFTFSTGSLFSEEKLLNIAVFPMRSAGELEGAIGEGLTPLVVDELSRSESLRVFRIEDLAKAAESLALSLSGLCDTTCQVSIGKFLNAQKIVTGEITQIGGKYILTMRVIEVETARTEYSSREDYRGEKENLDVPLTKLTKKIKGKLEGKEEVLKEKSLVKIPEIPTEIKEPLPKEHMKKPLELVFTSNRDGNYEIYKIDLETDKQTRLTKNNADDYYPCFLSKDGKIVYTSRQDGNEEIYIMDIDGKNQTRLTKNSSDDWQPNYSGVLKKIVFTSYRDKNAEVYIMDIDGKNQTRLTNNKFDDYNPVISPDGRKIAFTSNRDGQSEIYIMDIDGKNQTRLTKNSADDWAPVFSPDGKKIAFSSNRDGTNQVYIMDITGENQTRITFDNSNNWSPTFSSDGKTIAFHSDRDGKGEIYIISLETKEETKITENTFDDWSPSWGIK